MSETSHLNMNEFQYTVTNLLNESKLEKLTEVCLNEENRTKVIDGAMELFKSVFTYFLEKKTSEDDRKMIKNLFTFIGETANAKEMIVALWELFDPMYDLDAYDLLMPCLTTVCMKAIKRSPMNLNYYVGTTLSTITYYGEAINKPSYSAAPDSNPDFAYEEQRIFRFINGALKFASTLSDHLQQLKSDKHDILAKVEKEFVTFGAEILYLLCLLDLDDKLKKPPQSTRFERCAPQDTPQPPRFIRRMQLPAQHNESANKLNEVSERHSKQLLRLIFSIQPSWNLMRNTSWKSATTFGSEEDEDLSKRLLARGCMLYFLFVCHLNAESFPQILDPQFVFFSCMPSLFHMIASQNPAVIYKGLRLFFVVLSSLEPLTLSTSDFKSILCKKYREVNIVAELVKELTESALHCPHINVRTDCIKVAKLLLDKFRWPDRFNLIHQLLKNVTNSRVSEVLIYYFKEKLDEALKQEEDSSGSSGVHFFLHNTRIKEIFDMIFELTEDMTSDVLGFNERLMAAINCLRYLLLRDKKNRTTIWDHSASIQKNFVTPLMNNISLTKAQFNDELRKANSDIPEEQETNMQLGGVPLMSMCKDQRVWTISNELMKLDMMFSTCSLVVQNIEDRPSC